MNMEKLNVGALIDEVRRRPPLWDMTTEDYKYKAGKYEAWIEVCSAICEGFEEKSVPEKKVIVQSAKEKWRTLRDNFIRSKRKETKTTQKGRRYKRYAYWDLLQFLIPDSESQCRDSTVVCPLSNTSCTELSDYDPNESELSQIEIETDHSYVDLNVKTISHYQYEEIQMLDGEDIIVIPATSRTDSFTNEEKIEGLDINIEKLIDQVRVRPLLWDMTLDEYKDRARKSEAWLEVCNEVCERFKEKSNTEKIVIVQEVKLKWTSVRDNFIRSKRKQYQTSGNRRKCKKYMYWDQLQFLVPNFESRLTETPTTCPRHKSHSDLNCTEVSDFGPNEDSGPSQTQGKSQPEELHDWDGENVLVMSKENFLTQPRKQSNEEDVMKDEPQKKSEAEPVKMLSEDEQFFNSLLSSVADLSDLQKLKFRIEVMQALVRAKQF